MVQSSKVFTTSLFVSGKCLQRQAKGIAVGRKGSEVHFTKNRNSNSMENSFCSQSSCNQVIVMKICTWHDHTAVMECAKFCNDTITYSWVTPKPIIHWIWITMETLIWNGSQSWCIRNHCWTNQLSVFRLWSKCHYEHKQYYEIKVGLLRQILIENLIVWFSKIIFDYPSYGTKLFTKHRHALSRHSSIVQINTNQGRAW